jgi:hypothetical protein
VARAGRRADLTLCEGLADLFAQPALLARGEPESENPPSEEEIAGLVRQMADRWNVDAATVQAAMLDVLRSPSHSQPYPTLTALAPRHQLARPAVEEIAYASIGRRFELAPGVLVGVARRIAVARCEAILPEERDDGKWVVPPLFHPKAEDACDMLQDLTRTLERTVTLLEAVWSEPMAWVALAQGAGGEEALMKLASLQEPYGAALQLLDAARAAPRPRGAEGRPKAPKWHREAARLCARVWEQSHPRRRARRLFADRRDVERASERDPDDVVEVGDPRSEFTRFAVLFLGLHGMDTGAVNTALTRRRGARRATC